MRVYANEVGKLGTIKLTFVLPQKCVLYGNENQFVNFKELF